MQAYNFWWPKNLVRITYNCIWQLFEAQEEISITPTPLQFRAAYRKTLLAKISPSIFGNCKPNEWKVLLVNNNCTDEKKSLINSNELFNHNLEHDYCLPEYETISLYCEKVVCYVAGWLTRSLSKKMTCEDCLLALNVIQMEHDERDLLIDIKNRGGSKTCITRHYRSVHNCRKGFQTTLHRQKAQKQENFITTFNKWPF